MSHRWIDPAYDDLVTNQHLDGLYAKNAARVGRTVRSRDAAPEFLGSTDMGNVSQVVPSIHPMIAAAPSGTSIHTEAFAAAAVSDLGDLAVIDGARTLAATAIDLWARPELVAEAKTELRRRLGHDS
jgi:metal-dependent amidase/aminoacylase/carboxypeptidase family protein